MIALERGAVLPRGVGARDQKNREEVEDEHQSEKSLCTFIRAGEFFPDENAPEGGDHGSGLADGVGNCDAGEVGGDEIEDCAGGPDGAPEQAEDVAVHGAAKESAEGDGLAH